MLMLKKNATNDNKAKMPLWNDFVRSLSKNKTMPLKVIFLQSKANNGPHSQNKEKGGFSVRSEIFLQIAKKSCLS